MTGRHRDATLSSVRLLLLVPFVFAFVAACGDDSPNDGTTPTAPSTAITTPSPAVTASPSTQPASGPLLVVANSTGNHISLVNAGTGKVEARVEVGPAPWGIASRGSLAYVTTATSLVVMETVQGRILATLPLQAKLGAPSEGEYREGGMGLAISPDGERVYVGVYSTGGSFLEVWHARNGYDRSIPIGIRPFDVVAAPSGRTVYSIDHDSFTLTAIDTQTWQPRTIEAAPLGRGAYDKPHYGAIAGNELLLPYQGKTLVALNFESGATREVPLTANTHQHGIAVTPDGATAVIIGTGPAGGASGPPSLTLLTLATGEERVLPLSKPHELVVLSADGTTAFLSGGYLLGGWDGLTVVDLASGQAREIAVPDRPLGIVVLNR